MTPAELKLMDKITELELLLVDAKKEMKNCLDIQNLCSILRFRIDYVVERIDKALET